MNTPHGLPDSGMPHMLSFNHYAYGAVVDWVYRHVAGIAPDRARPGYRHVLFAPKPARGIDWANAAIETSYGRAAIGWRLDEVTLVADMELPFGTTGEFSAPATAASVVTIDGRGSGPVVRLEPGHHTVVVTSAAVADPARITRPGHPDRRPRMRVPHGSVDRGGAGTEHRRRHPFAGRARSSGRSARHPVTCRCRRT